MAVQTGGLVRTYAGRRVPVPGRYQVDVNHSSVDFVACDLMTGTVRGRFAPEIGTITVEELPERSSAEVSIDAGSLSTGNARRDRHFRGPSFFDTERHPAISFRSSRVDAGTAGRWTLTGNLTIRAVTRLVHFDATFEGVAPCPHGHDRIAFSGHVELDRCDWGLEPKALPWGTPLIAWEVQILIELEAVRVADAHPTSP